jgi:parvulin-like peptidyl-prolyl isomerase
MKFAFLFLLALALVSPVPLFADTGAELGNPVIAKGKGFEIRRGDLESAMAGLRSQIPESQTLTAERLVLNHLIEVKLLLAKATDADKAAGKKTADAQLATVIQNAGSSEAFSQRLKAMGTTEGDIKNKLIDDATAQAALERGLKISISDDDVKKYYDAHSADYEQPEMVRISHILIFTVDPITGEPLPANQLEYRRRKIAELLQAARAGQDFAALAKQYSEDAGSKDMGGMLLPFPRGQMAPEIDAAAFSLTNNEISDVITTATGYQIIKLLQKIPAQKTDYAVASAEIRQGLAQQQITERGPAYIESLRKEADVKILDSTLQPAPAAKP